MVQFVFCCKQACCLAEKDVIFMGNCQRWRCKVDDWIIITIRNVMASISACQPALSTKWLDWLANCWTLMCAIKAHSIFWCSFFFWKKKQLRIGSNLSIFFLSNTCNQVGLLAKKESCPVPFTRKSATLKSRLRHAMILWNALLTEVQSSNTLSRFKNSPSGHLLLKTLTLLFQVFLNSLLSFFLPRSLSLLFSSWNI